MLICSNIGDICFDHLVTAFSSSFLHCKMSMFPFVSNLWGITVKCKYTFLIKLILASRVDILNSIIFSTLKHLIAPYYKEDLVYIFIYISRNSQILILLNVIIYVFTYSEVQLDPDVATGGPFNLFSCPVDMSASSLSTF